MHIKLGFINYINTVPIYYGLLTDKISFPGIIVKEIPANLNRLLKAGDINMSPISSIEYARYQDDYYLIPNFCINSCGYVRSVILVSKYPIKELGDKKIGLTPASETSRALLKVIFSEYKIIPDYIELPGPGLNENEEVDAALLIGDHALSFKNSNFPYCFDLAQVWLEITGLPIVFALWAVRKDFADKWPHIVSETIDILEKSYEMGLIEPEGIIQLSSSMCPFSTCSYEDYFQNLGYRFEDDRQKALLIFYKKAFLLGLCRSCEKLEFFKI